MHDGITECDLTYIHDIISDEMMKQYVQADVLVNLT